MSKLKVIELFAGVGGFRVGLERANKKSKDSKFEVVWSNQWEPSTKTQTASDIYVKNFGDKNHCNEDISKVKISEIPEHDLLVGGFPCQDYSVANSLSRSGGLSGKKGVLWWEIHRILKEKKNKPKYLLLENVDRLLKSPAKQRGRDFAVMLSSLSDLGYAVEWRIINAADYGMPQKRRRVFFIGYFKNTDIYKKLNKEKNKANWVLKDGLIPMEFPCVESAKNLMRNYTIEGDLAEVSNNFNKSSKENLFYNSGLMINRNVITIDTKPIFKGKPTFLEHIIIDEKKVPSEFYITDKELEAWKYQKGSKQLERINKATGFKYKFSEGSMSFPDDLKKPGRTIITSEGGRSPSRFKHVIKVGNKHRRLTPLELERMNMFPDNHTEGATDIKRAFLMGNALVVGIIEKLGKSILQNCK